MIPALIVVGALALTTGVAAGAASHRPERTVVIERPEARHVEPRRHVSYVARPGEQASAEWRVAPAEGGRRSVRSWTANMGGGTHNGYDANQG